MTYASARPTISPTFAEFLPPWVSRQGWYEGKGVPRLSMVGAFRLEDPAGEVGMETHLLSDGDTVYQVPMTFRGAPLLNVIPEALIVQAEHSELGARWIYDAQFDPVWQQEMTRLVRESGTLSLRHADGGTPGAVTTEILAPGRLEAGHSHINLCRRLLPDPPDLPPGFAAALVTITSPQVTSRLAVIR